MKRYTLFLFFINIILTCKGTSICTVRFIGNMNSLALEKNGEIFIPDLTINPLIINTKDFEEPSKMAVVDFKTNKKVFFYLDNYSSEITIRTSDLNIISTNSKLNEEYLEYLNLTDSLDRSSQPENEKEKFLYKWCLQHTSSFVCFDFIQSELENNQADSMLVKNIFFNLNTSLYNYPTYKKYKLILAERKSSIEASKTIKPKQDNNILPKTKEKLFSTKETVSIIGKNLQDYVLLIDNEIIIDSLKKVNCIIKSITEPKSVTLINLNDTIALKNRSTKSLHFYLDIGIHDVTINLDRFTLSSKTSKLNNECNSFLQIKKHYDSLMENVRSRDEMIDKLGFRTNNNDFDSISHLYHRDYYNKCLTLPKSFITLEFVQFLLDSYKQVGITKNEVIKLFNILGNNLKKYPSYIEIKGLIEKNFLNISDENNNEKINEPLWNPYQK